MKRGGKKLLIISRGQFGYHIPNYTYCVYLKEEFEITFICWDLNKQKIFLDGITVIYVSRKGNFIVRTIRFLKTLLDNVKSNGTLIFITYFKFVSSILRLFKWKNPFILDIRTRSVEKNRFTRLFNNTFMKLESYFFKNKTIISKSLANKIKFNSDAYILPLGAEIISLTKKSFHTINLIYVGTLFNRNIEDTLIGFSKFYRSYHNKINIKYTIIGSGKDNEELILKNLTEKLGISHVVDIVGEIPHNNLNTYFDSHNIGVSYVPITDYYDSQPPLKTFEYLLSGMAVIATNTYENAAIINSSNGVIVQDNPESFYRGLVEIYGNRMQFDSDQIRDSSKDYTWEKIIIKFKAYLDSIYNKHLCNVF